MVRWARSHERPTAILMLTARDTVERPRRRASTAGADDYLVKPFEFSELLARIRALQRRPRGVEAPILRRVAWPSIRPGARQRRPVARWP